MEDSDDSELSDKEEMKLRLAELQSELEHRNKNDAKNSATLKTSRVRAKVTCEDCGKPYTSGDYKKHSQTHHKTVIKALSNTCSVCSKAIGHRNILAHVRRHSETSVKQHKE